MLEQPTLPRSTPKREREREREREKERESILKGQKKLLK